MRIAALMTVGFLVLGCASAPPAASPTPPTSPGVSPAATLAVSSASPSARPSLATGATPSQISAGGPLVDLTFAGQYTFTASGTGGRCAIGRDAAGNPTRFGFQATESDFAGLGQILSFDETNRAASGDSYIAIKWIVDASASYLDSPGETWSVGTDHKTLQIDDDLEPLGGGAEHISGTITCP